MLAGPPSRTYRAAKFVRRHRAGVAAAALTAAALFVATGVSVWQADLAREAGRRAQSEADTAEQVSAFLAGLFEESNPGRVREEELTAREVLDSGAARVERELVGQPRVQARLLRIIGEVYGRLGLYDASTPVLEKAIALNESLEPRDPDELALSLDALAANHHDQGRTEAGLPLASRAIAILEKEGAAGEKALGDVLVTHGNLLISSGKYEEAEKNYRRAIALIERHRGPGDGTLGRCYNNIANTRYFRGDYEGALAHYRKGLEIDERALGRDHYMVATELHNMSLVLTLLGRYEEALPLETRALEIREKVLGPHHWHTALSLANLGELKLELGRLAEAEALLERALAIDEEQYEPDKSETASDLDTLGRVYLAQDRPEEARAVFERSLAIRKRLHGASEVPYSHVSLGDYSHHVGDLARAESEYRQALALASPEDEGSATLRFDAHAGLARIALRSGPGRRGSVGDRRSSRGRRRGLAPRPSRGEGARRSGPRRLPLIRERGGIEWLSRRRAAARHDRRHGTTEPTADPGLRAPRAGRTRSPVPGGRRGPSHHPPHRAGRRHGLFPVLQPRPHRLLHGRGDADGGAHGRRAVVPGGRAAPPGEPGARRGAAPGPHQRVGHREVAAAHHRAEPGRGGRLVLPHDLAERELREGPRPQGAGVEARRDRA